MPMMEADEAVPVFPETLLRLAMIFEVMVFIPVLATMPRTVTAVEGPVPPAAA